MGLFTPNYVKPGPGIDKDAPPKTGLALFFEIFIREFWALVKLNVLFLLTCIPIVTIGAAMGAMTKVTVRMVRDIPNDVWYDYWRGFRENWKASTVLGLITAQFWVVPRSLFRPEAGKPASGFFYSFFAERCDWHGSSGNEIRRGGGGPE